ncbi:hypothetical protein NMG60_11026223 [Bertholletia excelsa]
MFRSKGPSSSATFSWANLKSITGYPPKLFSSSRKLAPEPDFPDNLPARQAKKAGKIHPLLAEFNGSRRNKATARPEFARYMEYVKEGGMWDVNSNMPVMYYK